MMNKILDYVISVLSSVNPMYQLVIILLAAPLLFLLYKIIKNKEFRISFFNLIKTLKNKETIYNLKHHEIFLSKSIYSQYIQNITFNSCIKNHIFRLILEKKINVILVKLKKFLNQDLNDIEEIDIEMSSLIEEIVFEYEDDIKNQLLKKYKDDADFLYTKLYINNFKTYHSNNITYILKGVKMFSKSRLTNNQKVYIFFNFIYLALDQAILDCEKVFDELNGDLNDYNNKWYKKAK